MLHLLDTCGDDETTRASVRNAFAAQLRAVVASRDLGDVRQVARAEQQVEADPRAAIRFAADGRAQLHANDRIYDAGRFEVLRLCELRSRALAARARAGRPAARRRLWIFDGASPLTDIGALQATASPGTLFQVASQFNCLEAPGAFVTKVAEYLHDPTQGPRASISAFPATLVRHYAAPAPDGARFTQQSDGPQLDLLADVSDPSVLAVRNGYLRAGDIADAARAARILQDRFEAIAVGVHDDAEVALGANWSGDVTGDRRIAQVFTSTIAGGMYGTLGDDDAAMAIICRQLQRAAYLGTLLAAAALGKRRVVLTLIGGGVFANPIETIWDALTWATDQIEPYLHTDLSIIVNGYSIGTQLRPAQLRGDARLRRGDLLRFSPQGVAFADD